ncbi:hypothetical protein [Pseudomonas oryzihabitans]|uniref:hypothetical protein n=1 Tax=Pseudomonas oryzihabitans TaxID=47885 RepID=UPI00111E9267|nr:hypothetical protein [Pseudomonas psychrotolerans]QDD91895.1 hypothetical protein CCZ28_23930 [Pseudomonas psychrotolerans]QDD91951.1 hypothetical protein CCZ28_24240 [Pseudomonas psychrotolerans]
MTILVQQLRDAAREIANWSGSLTDTWVSSQASYMWIVGCIDEDDQKYPVVRIEADAYGHQGESEKLAEFFRLGYDELERAYADWRQEADHAREQWLLVRVMANAGDPMEVLSRLREANKRSRRLAVELDRERENRRNRERLLGEQAPFARQLAGAMQ